MNLKGKLVTLRAIEEEDLEMLRAIMNDPDIEYFMAGWALPISKTRQKKWYENIINNPEEIRLIIETEEDGAVGVIVLKDIDWKNRVALLHGVKINNQRFRAKGIGTDAMMTMTKYAFDQLQLNRLEGDFIEYNKKSQKLCFEKLGWKLEGVKRKAIFKNGQYHDLIIGGILREDYYELVERTGYWAEGDSEKGPI